MMMSAPSPIWASMALSGLKKCDEPSRCERKVTPSSVHLAQFVQAENLEAARVGENRARPGHETMQAAELPHLLHSRPQIKMVGIPQKDLYADFFQDVLRNAFD